ncbi:MAG: CDP-alcohol phosphatidyltransferase family protein [Dysgonamonadaceae bacterium]|jgi:CDP-diacylglycerol--serine O-phosphatidyltransferase|nr:CDP-alcohol phosphatidyltransferase family protein [Dysgonamonadaceae bacterium]
MKKHIPNFITCLNLFAGCIACVLAFEGRFVYAFACILLAAVFDFFDGLAARFLKAYSPLGKELDSLADAVSFGVAPGFMVYAILLRAAGSVAGVDDDGLLLVPYIAFLLPVFSALRLAKFNIDERQTTSFIGLPTPANAIFWASGIAGTAAYAETCGLWYGMVTMLLVIVFSGLLVSEIPMFSLKIKSLSWKGNERRYILIASSIPAVIVLKSGGLSAVILLYIFLSLLEPRKPAAAGGGGIKTSLPR